MRMRPETPRPGLVAQIGELLLAIAAATVIAIASNGRDAPTGAESEPGYCGHRAVCGDRSPIGTDTS